MPSVPQNVTLHKGWFDTTLPVFIESNKDPVRFINIDCDLYSSTKTVLENLNSQIVKDTIIRFDDLLPSPISPYPNWLNGEWKALSEWAKDFERKIIPISRSWKQGCTVLVLK